MWKAGLKTRLYVGYYVRRAKGIRVSAQDDDVTIDPELTRAALDLGVTSAVTEGPAQAGHDDRSRATDFAPGAIIAGRYRLVALLGRGGMGEVYRADDLTLDQPVALKFLPAAIADGDTRLSQFHNELRVARQVSRRLYDLGDANGRRFLTMEYVDGEDLGSLLTDPPLTETGQRLIVLDGAGRLVEFRSVPRQYEESVSADSPSALSWSALFAAAGLDMSAFSPVAPQWTPRDYADTRAAWQGPLPGRTDITLRVEAAAYRGKPVSFLVAGPWTKPTLMVVPRRSTIDTVAAWILVSVVAVLLAAAVLLARRNITSQRADRHGAMRVALFIGCGALLGWIVEAQHISRVDVEFGAFLDALGDAVAGGMGVWVLYVALEPYVRRFWPDSLLGWSRLVAGHINDPRVGRDVLIGGLFGVAMGLVEITKLTLIPRLGYTAQRPAIATRLEALSGLGPMLSVWNDQILNAVVFALLTVLVVVVLRLALKRSWLVMPLSVVLLSTSLNYLGGSGPVTLVFPLLGGVLMTLVTVRYGLLSLVVARAVWDLIYTVPMMPVMNHWSAAAGNWTIALLIALTLWAFYASRAGQPLFGSLLKE